MNFLAHYLLATRFLPPPERKPLYVVGSALPDLLPLASPHRRLRLSSLPDTPASDTEEEAITAGVRAHLLTDAAFHHAAGFLEAQSRVGVLISQAGFVGIRVRRFFLAHVLTELALDAALLRRQPGLADDFYRDFNAADPLRIVRWAETALAQAQPGLSDVLTRFAASRYLSSYVTDAGVTEGLCRLSLRARQDAFRGDNRHRLAEVVSQAVPVLTDRAESLVEETATAVQKTADGEFAPDAGIRRGYGEAR